MALFFKRLRLCNCCAYICDKFCPVALLLSAFQYVAVITTLKTVVNYCTNENTRELMCFIHTTQCFSLSLGESLLILKGTGKHYSRVELLWLFMQQVAAWFSCIQSNSKLWNVFSFANLKWIKCLRLNFDRILGFWHENLQDIGLGARNFRTRIFLRS